MYTNPESDQKLQTYLPFHLQSFWDDFYTKRGFDTLNWYFDITQLDIPEFSLKNFSSNSDFLIFGAGTSSILDYLDEKGFKTVIVIEISEVLVNHYRDKYSHNTEWGFEQGDVSNLPDLLLSSDTQGVYSWIIDKGCLDCWLSDPEKAEEMFINAVKGVYNAWTENGVFYYFSNGKPEDRVNLLYNVPGIKYKIVPIDMNQINKEDFKEFNQSDNMYYLYIIRKALN